MQHVGYPQSPRLVGSCIRDKGHLIKVFGHTFTFSFFYVITRVLFCLLSKQIHLDQGHPMLRRAASRTTLHSVT